MPTSRYGLVAAAVGGKIYAMGGYTTAATNINEEYVEQGTLLPIDSAEKPLGLVYRGAKANFISAPPIFPDFSRPIKNALPS